MPGTFSVEKGIRRYLHRTNKYEPASLLRWPYSGLDDIEKIKIAANDFLIKNDYIGVSRVLAVLKMLTLSKEPNDYFYKFSISFGAPFLLGYERGHSSQWAKLQEAFKVIRHLAYLTLDSQYSGLQWAPSIPMLVDHLLKQKDVQLQELTSSISEILSPLERLTYETVYHCEDARKEAAVISEYISRHLSKLSQPIPKITGWTSMGLFQELRLGQRPSHKSVNLAACIKLRSHFSTTGETVSQLEGLQKKGFTHPAVFEYKSWNSDKILEPDELLIDVMTQDKPCIHDAGKLLIWFISHFDDLDEAPDAPLALLKKTELEMAYILLLKRAIELSYPEVEMKIDSWPLGKFGLFSDYSAMLQNNRIWACSAKLDDPFTRYILRDRTKKIPQFLRDQYAELFGIKKLRDYMKTQWTAKEPRQKWLMLTGSIKFCKYGRPLIEYDGGLVKVSSRGGNMTWYGLESKRGKQNPLKSLNKRLKAIGISGNTVSLSNRYAFVELIL